MITTESTRNVVGHFFERTGEGGGTDGIASLFTEDVDWLVPGDERIQWIGRKVGRAGVVDFIRDLREFTTPIRANVRTIVTEGQNAVALLELETRVNKTRRIIRTEAAFDFTVQDGLIVRFRLFEDSYRVSQAVMSD